MLSKRTKYALKALLCLYENRANSPVSAKLISEKENIPYKFLENILRELKQHKIIKSERGSGGGYHFFKNPEDVTVSDIIRIVDGPIALIPCVSDNFYEKCMECNDEETCKIRKLFGQVRAVMLPLLDKSIADLSSL